MGGKAAPRIPAWQPRVSQPQQAALRSARATQSKNLGVSLRRLGGA